MQGGYFDVRLTSRLELRRQWPDAVLLVTGLIIIDVLETWVGPAVGVTRADVTVGVMGEGFPPTPNVTGEGPGIRKVPKSLYMFGQVTLEYNPGIKTMSLSDG